MELPPQVLGTYAHQKGRWWKEVREDVVVVGEYKKPTTKQLTAHVHLIPIRHRTKGDIHPPVFNKITELWGPECQVLMAARFAHRSGTHAPTASHSQNKIK